eukprot:06324_4
MRSEKTTSVKCGGGSWPRSTYPINSCWRSRVSVNARTAAQTTAVKESTDSSVGVLDRMRASVDWVSLWDFSFCCCCCWARIPSSQWVVML